MILDSKGRARIDDSISPELATKLLANFSQNRELLKKMDDDIKFREAVFLSEKATGVSTILGQLWRQRARSSGVSRETERMQNKAKGKLESIMRLKGMNPKVENETIQKNIVQKGVLNAA